MNDGDGLVAMTGGIGRRGGRIVGNGAAECRGAALRFNFPVRGGLLGNDGLIIENLGFGLKEVLGTRVMVAAVLLRINAGDASSIAPLAMSD
jgi:kynurenine formamidase